MEKQEEYLQGQGISPALISAASDFRREYAVDAKVAERVANPAMPFYGKETLEMAMKNAVMDAENVWSFAQSICSV